MKKTLGILLVLVLTISLFAGCNSEDAENKATEDEVTSNNGGEDVTVTDFNDEVVFTVNDQEIMLSEINFWTYYYKSMYEGSYGISDWDMEMGEGLTLEDGIKDTIKGVSVQGVVMVDLANEYGLELTEESKEEYLAQAVSIYESFDPTIVAQYGFSLENIEKIMIQTGLSELVFEEMTKDVEIDEEALQVAVEADPTYTDITNIGVENYSDQVRARHILISTVDQTTNQPLEADEIAAAKEKAENLLERAKAGEDFATLATENTEDPGSVETGGEYTFGRGQMVPEFEETAFGLEEGQISDLVATSYGYHIIKLEEKLPSTQDQVEQVEATLDSIRENYKYQQRSEAFTTLYEEVMTNYETVVNEDVWEKVTLK
jgi:parvulin-like peptidyl-prolyl isomerase